MSIDAALESFLQVALKVIKHCEEEGSSSELVTGFLVGLVVGNTLEITNCFPLPKDLDDPEEESEWVWLSVTDRMYQWVAIIALHVTVSFYNCVDRKPMKPVRLCLCVYW